MRGLEKLLVTAVVTRHPSQYTEKAPTWDFSGAGRGVDPPARPPGKALVSDLSITPDLLRTCRFTTHRCISVPNVTGLWLRRQHRRSEQFQTLRWLRRHQQSDDGVITPSTSVPRLKYVG